MLPRTATAPTPIDTFCQVFIASTFYVPALKDGVIRHTIPYVRRGRNVSGLDEDREIKTVSYIDFRTVLIHLSGSKIRAVAHSIAASVIHYHGCCFECMCIPVAAILDVFRTERNSIAVVTGKFDT